MRAPYLFSKGHGAHSDTEAVRAGKTEIRPSAVNSVNAQRGQAIDAGRMRLGGGPLDVSLVPRASDPTQYRPLATKTGGGGAAGLTSFPLMPSDIPDSMLASAGVPRAQVVHAPTSPGAAPAAAAGGAAHAPAPAPATAHTPASTAPHT